MCHPCPPAGASHRPWAAPEPVARSGEVRGQRRACLHVKGRRHLGTLVP